MNRWLQDNPIGLVLAALCGVLVLTMAVLGIVSMLPVAPDPGDGENAAEDGALSLPELGESPPLDAYYVITERPLFNESRQPVLESDLDLDPLAGALQDENQEPPDVELSGVVITPSLRMAMLRKKDEDRSLVAMEGWPIEGEFSSWELSRVDPREVLLTSAAGEELLLKLKVHDEKIAPPARSAPEPEKAEKAASSSEEQAEGQPLSRAEEIRQRIAERREELRRQAEMEEQEAEQAEQPTYQQAIQSMIGRNRRNNSNNQDE